MTVTILHQLDYIEEKLYIKPLIKLLNVENSNISYSINNGTEIIIVIIETEIDISNYNVLKILVSPHINSLHRLDLSMFSYIITHEYLCFEKLHDYVNYRKIGYYPSFIFNNEIEGGKQSSEDDRETFIFLVSGLYKHQIKNIAKLIQHISKKKKVLLISTNDEELEICKRIFGMIREKHDKYINMLLIKGERELLFTIYRSHFVICFDYLSVMISVLCGVQFFPCCKDYRVKDLLKTLELNELEFNFDKFTNYNDIKQKYKEIKKLKTLVLNNIECDTTNFHFILDTDGLVRTLNRLIENENMLTGIIGPEKFKCNSGNYYHDTNVYKSFIEDKITRLDNNILEQVEEYSFKWKGDFHGDEDEFFLLTDDQSFLRSLFRCFEFRIKKNKDSLLKEVEGFFHKAGLNIKVTFFENMDDNSDIDDSVGKKEITNRVFDTIEPLKLKLDLSKNKYELIPAVNISSESEKIEVKSSEVKSSEVKSSEVKSSEVKSSEVKSSEVIILDIGDMSLSESIGNELTLNISDLSEKSDK